MNIITAAAIAFSFLTVIPVPQPEWRPSRLRLFPLMFPLVGLVVGILGGGLFLLLSRSAMTPLLQAVLLCLFYLAVTGGLHMDGFMDTCDAVFSRQPLEKRLEILTDTHVGAFAVMGCIAILLLKTGIFYELVDSPPSLLVLILFPVFSRLGLAALFYTLPPARKEGLAHFLGENIERAHLFVFIALFLSLSSLLLVAEGYPRLLLPAVSFSFLFLYVHFCRKTFGGITGDLMGTYLEVSELLMLATIAALRR